MDSSYSGNSLLNPTDTTSALATLALRRKVWRLRLYSRFPVSSNAEPVLCVLCEEFARLPQEWLFQAITLC